MPLDEHPPTPFQNAMATREFFGLPTYSCEAELFAALVLPSEQPGRWVANPFKGKLPEARTFTLSGNWSKLNDAALASCAQGQTAYFCTARLMLDNEPVDPKTGEVGAMSHADVFISAKRCLHVDIDVGKEGFVQSQADAWELLLSLCKTLGIPQPSLVVNSGFGWHCYWCFDQDVTDLALWQRIADGLLAGATKHAPALTADTSKWKTRGALLRWPGTINFKKSGQRPVLIDWEKSGYGTSYDLEAFTPLLELVVERPPAKERVASAQGTITCVTNAPSGGELEWVACALKHVERASNWALVGMALHLRFAGSTEAYAVLDAWTLSTSRDGDYDAAENLTRWNSFNKRNPERDRIVSMGSLYRWAEQGGWTHGPWREPITFDALPDGGYTAPEVVCDAAAKKVAEPKPHKLDFNARVRPVGLSLEGLAAMKPREWIVPGFLSRGETCVLVAQGGVGKSQISLSLAVSIAGGDGRQLGFDVRDQGPILILNAEDDESDINRRLGAIQIAHGVETHGLPIHSYNGDGCRFVGVARTLARGGLDKTLAMADLEAWCMANKPALIVLDPLAKAHQGDENSNADMTLVVDAFNQLARKVNCAVLIVHHTSKPSKASPRGREGDQHASRGASAVIDGVRGAKTLFSMDAETATQYGIADADRYRFIQLSDAKANHSARGATGHWFRMDSIKLPNGEDAPALSPVNFSRADDMAAIAERVYALIYEAEKRGSPLASETQSASSALHTCKRELNLTPEVVNDALNRLSAVRRIISADFTKDSKTKKRWLIVKPANSAPDSAEF